MSEIQQTTIDLLRHGACEGGEIFRGSTDVALTDLGWQQMQQALNSHHGWQCIVSSSLQRCARFAEQLAAQKQLPLRIESNFREIHFGEWEGKRIVDVERTYGETLNSFWSDPLRYTPPQGEPLADFRVRVMHAAEKILSEHRGQHILLVSHGAVIRMLLCEWLQMSMQAFSAFSIPYASLSRVRIYHFDNKPDWLQLIFHRGEAALLHSDN